MLEETAHSSEAAFTYIIHTRQTVYQIKYHVCQFGVEGDAVSNIKPGVDQIRETSKSKLHLLIIQLKINIPHPPFKPCFRATPTKHIS